jgi:hypothetical protein
LSNNQLIGENRVKKEKPSWWDGSKHGVHGSRDDHYDTIPDMDGIIAIANAIKDMGALLTLNLTDNQITDPATLDALVNELIEHKPDLKLISGPLAVCISLLTNNEAGEKWEPPALGEAQDKALLESLQKAIEIVDHQNDLHGGNLTSVSALGLIMTMFLKEFMLELLDIGSDFYTYIEVKESKSANGDFKQLYFGFFLFSVAASVCVQFLRIYLFRPSVIQKVSLGM